MAKKLSGDAETIKCRADPDKYGMLCDINDPKKKEMVLVEAEAIGLYGVYGTAISQSFSFDGIYHDLSYTFDDGMLNIFSENKPIGRKK